MADQTYPIETARLLLRPLDPMADVDAVHAYQSRADVCRYIPYDPRTREEVAAKLADPESRSQIDAEGQVLHLAVVLRSTGELIGDVVLFHRSELHRTGEIGYVINPDFQGHGYAAEVCAPLLRIAFDDLGMRRVVARIDQRNAASAATLRRAGLRQEAVLVENEWFKGEWTTEVDFAILDHEWRAQTGSTTRPATGSATRPT